MGIAETVAYNRFMIRGLLVMLALAGLAVLLFAFAAGSMVNQYASELPKVEEVMAQLQDSRLPLSSEVFDRNGEVIGEFLHERRYYVPLAKIPLILQQAILSAEDKDFYQHPGYSAVSMLRAAWANVQQRKVSQGASTITQQLARLYFLSRARTFERKIKEIILAIEIEKHLSKDQILELYLNKIYLGQGAYGVEAASRRYFQKSVDQLHLAEAALLAGLPQAPSRLDPSRNLPGALERRRLVLDLMVENKYISAYARDQVVEYPLQIQAKLSKTEVPYFIEMVRQEFERKFAHWRPQTSGLKIYTSLDGRVQQVVTESFRRELAKVRKLSARSNPGKVLDLEEEIQGAAVAINPTTGGVVAVQGGSRFEDTQFNRALMTNRPLGAQTLMLIAAGAFEHGYTATSSIDSDPYQIKDADHLEQDTIFRMLMTRDADAGFRLFSKLGLDNVARVANRCNLKADTGSLMFGLGDGATSPMRLASCLASFANEGLRAPTYVIEAIRSREGELLYQRDNSRPIRVVKSESAFLVKHLFLESEKHDRNGQRVPVTATPSIQGGSYLSVNPNLQDMWLTGLTPSLALVFWYGSEHGKARLVSQKQDGLALMTDGYGSLLRALPRDKQLFSTKKNVYYERVKISEKSDAVRIMPRFRTAGAKQTF